MSALSWLLSLPTFFLALLHFYRVRTPAGVLLFIPKLTAGGLSLYLALGGILGAALGAAAGAWAPAILGLTGAVLSARYALRAGSSRGDFAAAFGPGWETMIPIALRERIARARWSLLLRDSGGPSPLWQRDLTFWAVPGPDGTERPLLCDLWEPPPGVARTGLAFIYFHGSAWHFLDKDFLTRPLFRHLAGQGHVVMDVAYRLCPETDIFGMVGDVRRAVAWVKREAPRYGLDPSRVVVGGGSAGGHISLLAAYLPTPDTHPAGGRPGTPASTGHPRDARLDLFSPDDLRGLDTSVAGVVSFYGPTDLRDCSEHTGLGLFTAPAAILRDRPGSPAGRLLTRLLNSSSSSSRRKWGNPAVLGEGADGFARNMVGAPLAEVDSHLWDLVSPAAHVRPGLPPALLFHGNHDCLAPVEPARVFHRRLLEAGVPVIYIEYPDTEHAFDLGALRISPAGQNAVYHLDRFLAVLAGGAGARRASRDGPDVLE